MIKKLLLVMALITFSFLAFSQGDDFIHIPGCTSDGTMISNIINVRVHQWIDLTWDATPYHICDSELNLEYADDGYVLLSIEYASNEDVQVSVDFPDPYFRDEFNTILQNITIYFFVKSIDATTNEDSYFQINYVLGDLTRMGTDTSLPVFLPEVSQGSILFTINTITSDPGSLETPAGVYHLPVRITFNPTVEW